MAFGTIDSWLLWQLTRGKVHATDTTNASRTLLFNIHEQCWDEELLALFQCAGFSAAGCARQCRRLWYHLPGIVGRGRAGGGYCRGPAGGYGRPGLFSPGMVKSTYGTGTSFMVMNTGEAVESHNRLLTTVGYRLNGKTTYALEGSIFVAGAAIQWLRDGLNLIRDASETEALARRAGSAGGVYLVPAFTGGGALVGPPCRGALLGLTRDTGIAEVVAAGLEAVCYQSRDLLDAMAADCGTRPTTLRVDGGMVVNNWLSQTLSDVLGVCVDRPVVTETTALGAAYLAGLGVGLYTSRPWPSSGVVSGSFPGAGRGGASETLPGLAGCGGPGLPVLPGFIKPLKCIKIRRFGAVKSVLQR